MSFVRKFIAGAVITLSATSFAAAADRWMEIPEPPAMPAAAESGTAPVNGIDMYYAVYGAGEPVLLPRQPDLARRVRRDQGRGRSGRWTSIRGDHW